MGWERKRGKLHELNRLLRGATDTTFLAHRRPAAAVPAGVRYVITLDADTRLPRDAVAPPGRQDGASAQPAALRCRDRARRRGLRRPAAARHAVAAGRRARARSSSASSPAPSGIDPYAAAVSDVYQDLFGEGSYTGKGIYDVDAFEAALARPRARQHAAQPRSVRRHLRPRRAASDVEVVEEFPARYDVAARAPASLGARRLAAAAVDPRRGASGRRATRRRSRRSAAGRCSTTCGARCRRRPRRSRCSPGWTLPLAGRARLDRLRPADDRAADAPAGRRGDLSRGAPASRCAATSRALGADLALALAQIALARRLPRASGLADGRRDRAHAVPAVRHAAGTARMDHGGAGQRSARGSTCSASTGAMAGGVVARRSSALVVVWRLGARRWPLAAAVRCCCGSPRRRSRAGSAARRAIAGSRAGLAGRRARAAADRAAHLALLRDLRHGGRQHAAAGQFPGGSRRRSSRTAPRRPTSASICCRRSRARDFGWIGTRRRGRAARGDAGDDGAARALPRPLLQLVRHARPAAARAALRLLGRQRQPGRPPDRARQRLPRVAASPAPRAGSARRASTTRSTWPARRCALAATTGARRPSRGAARRRARRDLGDAAAAARRRRDPTGRRLRAAGRERAVDTGAGALASERGDDARRRHAVLGRGRSRAPSTAIARDLLARDPTRRSIVGSRRSLATARGDGRRHGLRLPARPRAQAALDRLSRRRRHARPELLRPARLRGAARELRRDRQGRRRRRGTGSGSAAPSTPIGARRGADLVVGLDVRVPDAVAGHARAGAAACSSRPAGWSCGGRSPTAPSSACPGASRSRPTTRATSSSPISTRTSACRASG